MPFFDADYLKMWAQGRWTMKPAGPLMRVVHDSREVRTGDLFVAIRGDRFDGHRFVREAFEQGAAGAMVESSFEASGLPLLRVQDTAEALWLLAKGYRASWRGKVFAITGSVGKTTVKELMAAALSAGGKVCRTPGNYNNELGVPLSILAAEADADYYVLEIGMSHPGEIAPLAELVRPDVGVITTVGAAHLEAFGSVEAIADEKASLLRYVRDRAVLAPDEPSYERLRPDSLPVTTVGLGGDVDFRGNLVGKRMTVMERSGELAVYDLPLPGEHMARNVLRAVAVARLEGISSSAVAGKIRDTVLPGMRWEQTQIDGVEFVNDAYNANPVSMRAAIETFMREPFRGQRWLVLGGMRELGKSEQEAHRELGRYAARQEAQVLAIGELGRYIAEGGARIRHCDTKDQAARLLSRELEAGDAVLLKASRGERLEEVLEYFSISEKE